MIKFWREIIVPWGESDPFGLVYYPRIVAWFNDTEHELFRNIGYPIEQMIEKNKTTFVMGEIQFRFIGPAAYGDRIMTKISLEKLGKRTLHWEYEAKNSNTEKPICEGKATRVYAQIQMDGNLQSQLIPDYIINAIKELENFDNSGTAWGQ